MFEPRGRDQGDVAKGRPWHGEDDATIGARGQFVDPPGIPLQ